jgi:hypothetical protein
MCAGEGVQRRDLGLPAEWETIESWIDDSRDIAAINPATQQDWKKKNPEIPVLRSYDVPPPSEFWDSFPNNYPSGLKRIVNVVMLKKYVERCWNQWTLPQKRTAEKLLKNLEGNSPAPLKQHLPGLIEKNAPSALENGEFMTDVLATWVKKGFVAGPFPAVPLENFRANPLMAAVQKTKVRPILNLSSPKGRSFNNAVNEWEIENLVMSTPKLFGESLMKAGRGAFFSKTDIQDAYKLIPNPVNEWRYYGFSWLGKFFLDTTTVFGSKVAPASFDPLPETIVNITCCIKKIPKQWIHRQLDDVPIVSPKGSGITETFTKGYAKICADLGVPLAENCPNHEKAFGPSTFGTVLGIGFDSTNLEWYLGKDKAHDHSMHRWVPSEKNLHTSGSPSSAWKTVRHCPNEQFSVRFPVPLGGTPEKV